MIPGEAAGDPRGVYRALRAMLGRTALVVRHSRQIWELRLAGLADAASEVHRALVAETPALFCLPTPDAVLAEPAAAEQAETPSSVSQIAPVVRGVAAEEARSAPRGAAARAAEGRRASERGARRSPRRSLGQGRPRAGPAEGLGGRRRRRRSRERAWRWANYVSPGCEM
jgi:hypothetical protein